MQAGVCLRLYPRAMYAAMNQYQLPEMLRTNLEELCLQIKGLHLGKVAPFLDLAMQPPPTQSVRPGYALDIVPWLHPWYPIGTPWACPHPRTFSGLAAVLATGMPWVCPGSISRSQS